LLLCITPGISFAQSASDNTVKDSERGATEDEVRDQVRDEVREQRIQDARDRLAEKHEQLKRDREAQIDAHREKLEKGVISDFIDKPYNPDPACPDWDLQLVNLEVDGITDTKILKCYAKYLKPKITC
jgi:hypothetical protein